MQLKTLNNVDYLPTKARQRLFLLYMKKGQYTMSDSSKYYYLKLKDNFFDDPQVKAIESYQNGYEYICIIQKMYLRSLKRGGKLMLTDKIPYDIKTLSRVLGHKEETVKAAIEIFVHFELCEILDDQSIYMTEIQNYIGRSSTEADRKRLYRAKIDGKKLLNGQMSGQKSDKNPPKIEVESEIKIELEEEHTKRFHKPTVQQIAEYCKERNNNIDPQYFFDKNESIGWVVGKNKTPMKDWKATIRTWESNEKKFNPPEKKMRKL